MKKLFAACICLCFTFSMAGCSLGTLIDRFVSAGDASVSETTPDKPRVYMDELKGILHDFTGSQITVLADKELYIFDVSQASLECEDGMITGDEVSVIYEGQLDDTDTSGVKALKVVDEYHKKTQLKDTTIEGTVLDFTPNTMTIKSQEGNTVTFPIAGAKQYYQNGIRKDAHVFLHYKGKILSPTDENSGGFNASHLKVLSISDVEPLKVPEPTPTPSPEENAVQENKLYCVVNNVSLNILQVVIEGTNTSLKLDLAALPCYFPGGISEGSHVTVTYTGEFNGTTPDGLTLLGITGENPASQKDSHISFRVAGTIIGSTANTVTIRTGDNAVFTFDMDKALNSSTGGLAEGCGIRITFNPAASNNSNIYSGLKIEDA
ncbi:MAG: hypothetical protein Q4C77_16085 [Eubacteriales bacterium]|nr:hypothetical protein [Eubacteriales bacterium]